MHFIKFLSPFFVLMFTTLATANTYEIDYKDYRNIPSDSTLNQLIQLITENNITTADSLYKHTLDQLKKEHDFSGYMFYANEYSYSRYSHNTRIKNTAFQILDSALKVAKPHLSHDNFELFLGEYNMNFYIKDNYQRIEWIKSALSRLDFNKYDFALPIYTPMASLYYEISEYDSAWHYWDIVKNDTTLAKRYMANLYSTIGAKTATFDSEIAIDFIKQAMLLRKDYPSADEDLKAHRMLTGLYIQIADYKNAIKHGTKLAELIDTHKDLYSIKSLTNHSNWINIIESYAYLDDTKMARYWINDMSNRMSSFRSPAVSKIRKDWIYGLILNTECKYDSAQYYYDLSNQGFLGLTKDSLSNYLTNGYYYKAESYLKSNQVTTAIDYYQKAIVAFNYRHYNTIDDTIKPLSPDKIFKPYLIYNIDMILDLLNAHKTHYLQQHELSSLEEILRLSKYCNQLIKHRFRGIATPESALKTSGYLKKSCSYGLFASYELSKKETHYLDSAFIMADLPHSFTLNYNKQLAGAKNSDSDDALMQSIAQLSIELANAEQAELSQEEIFEIKYQLYRSKSILTRTQIKDFSFMDNSGSYENVKSQLSDKDAVIQITCQGDSCYIICLTTEEDDIQLRELHNINKKISRLTRAIKTNDHWQEASRPLYETFISPFENQLSDKKSLILYVDEKLQSIPFSLLTDAHNDLLIMQFALKYHNSAKTYSPKPSTPKSILIMAPGFEKVNDISQNNMLRSISLNKEVFRSSGDRTQLSPLPFSLSEAKTINKTFKKNKINSQLTTGVDASKQYFINHTQDYDILHLATHGIASDPYQTGLFFSPDSTSNNASFISTSELYKQNLNAQLVVLSACQSGIGEMAAGEGIIGLPRSFMYAGAQNIIASLWKVHDSKTQTLMTAFYSHLLSENISYQEALKRAQLDCINKGYLAMDWAGFILISE